MKITPSIEPNERLILDQMATASDILNQPLWEKETVNEVSDALLLNDKHIGNGAECEMEGERERGDKWKRYYSELNELMTVERDSNWRELDAKDNRIKDLERDLKKAQEWKAAYKSELEFSTSTNRDNVTLRDKLYQKGEKYEVLRDENNDLRAVIGIIKSSIPAKIGMSKKVKLEGILYLMTAILDKVEDGRWNKDVFAHED